MSQYLICYISRWLQKQSKQLMRTSRNNGNKVYNETYRKNLIVLFQRSCWCLMEIIPNAGLLYTSVNIVLCALENYQKLFISACRKCTNELKINIIQEERESRWGHKICCSCRSLWYRPRCVICCIALGKWCRKVWYSLTVEDSLKTKNIN